MAGKKISQLPKGTAISGPEQLPAVQSGTTKKFTFSVVLEWLKTALQTKITASGILKGNGAGGVSTATPGTDYATPAMIPTQASDIGAAERFHASAYNVFGVGTGSLYGHLKLSDVADNSKDSTAGTAVTPFALYNLQFETFEKANWDSITERAEFGTTATHAYQPGEYYRSAGAIYKVKQTISIGDPFTASNSELTTVMDPLAGAIFAKTIGSWNDTSPFSVYLGNDSAHLLIVTSTSSLKQAMVLVNCSSSGAVVYASIYKGNYITISTATGRIDFTLTTAGNTTRVTDMPLVGNYATVSS